jgi:putative phosphoribosyl transferase
LSRAIYKDREEAGRVLAAAVRAELGRVTGRPLVLAIPRGGVPVGSRVADVLGTDLDVTVPRKIGAEGNPEFGIGAVMQDGTTYLSPEAVRITGASDEYVEAQKRKEMKEAARRVRAYRDDRPEPELAERTVIVVDDGIATGATMVVALRWLRSRGTRLVVVAAPVAPPSTVESLRHEADAVVCPRAEDPFHAIGEFYSNFDQVSDEKVTQILRHHWRTSRR